MWPFLPENQYDIDNDAEEVREFKKRDVSKELYGPIWIIATFIIELCIVGHLIGVFRLEAEVRLNKNQFKFMNEDLVVKFANHTLHKMFTTIFLLSFFYILNPFIGYLTFKNRGAVEVTFT